MLLLQRLGPLVRPRPAVPPHRLRPARGHPQRREEGGMHHLQVPGEQERIFCIGSLMRRANMEASRMYSIQQQTCRGKWNSLSLSVIDGYCLLEMGFRRQKRSRRERLWRRHNGEPFKTGKGEGERRSRAYGVAE